MAVIRTDVGDIPFVEGAASPNMHFIPFKPSVNWGGRGQSNFRGPVAPSCLPLRAATGVGLSENTLPMVTMAIVTIEIYHLVQKVQNL